MVYAMNANTLAAHYYSLYTLYMIFGEVDSDEDFKR